LFSSSSSGSTSEVNSKVELTAAEADAKKVAEFFVMALPS